MDSRAKSQSEKSLCERSMKVVANIIRVSSFSIALKTLGTTSGKAPGGLSLSGSDMVPGKEQFAPDQFYESKRSKGPQSHANPTYVLKPVLSNGSTSHVIQEQRVHAKQKKEEGIDVLASEYIRKIRKQLGCGL